MSSFVIGVDVGGTNTDAVILKGRQVISSCKKPTTLDPTEGIINAISGALDALKDFQPDYVRSRLCRVCIGTTHFVNAVVERRKDKLVPVAVIRLCGPASRAVPPFADFPADLNPLMKGRVYMVSGGVEYNGKHIAEIQAEELQDVVKDILECQPPLKNIVVSGVFSPLGDPEKNQERKVVNILKNNKHCKDFSFTMASWIGRLGLIERENAAILNESLKPLAAKTITAFKTALKGLKLNCQLYLTQNDGTLISVDEAMKHPILTFSSGPTNSMRGAMFLSGKKDAIVIDIGGTTTDIGILCNGFPREASSQVKIGGVRTNFQMPDVVSIGLGGGSIVSVDPSTCQVKVGPESVGYQLVSKALCFGGDTCTATDVALSAGVAKDIDGAKCVSISPHITYQAMREIHQKLETIIDLVKTDKKDLPVLLVGGGGILVDLQVPLKGTSNVTFPPNYQVANAVGAALGMVAGYSERVEDLREVINVLKKSGEEIEEEELRRKAREIVIQKGIDIATQAARNKGSSGSEVLHEKSVMAVTYIPDALKVSIKMIGSLTEETLEEPNTITPDINVDDDKPQVNYPQIKNNPIWPFCSEEDKKKDEFSNLPSPKIDKGEWILSSSDVECISIGAGILGCGGGGDPDLGRVMALQLLEKGKEIRILNPCSVPQESFGLAVAVCFMGAPVIINEKLASGTETELCLKTLQNILATGICEESCNYGRKEVEGVSLATMKLENGHDVWWIPDVTNLPIAKLNDPKIPLERRVSALICAEIGGLNSFEPLLAGTRLGLPVLDADGMGRAFPELQMFLPFINGVSCYPSCVADEKGNVVAVTHVDTAKDLEDFFRTECIRMGMSCGISLAPMSLKDILETCVLYSFSQAWQLGRAIFRARNAHTSVVDAVVEHKGKVLLTGKVIDVDRTTSAGFTGSILKVEGLKQFSGIIIEVIAKNENLIARRLNSNGCVGDVLAVTPDLITIIDSDTGYPITTEDVSYGLRVSVLALPAYTGLTTPNALDVVGPKGFGFENIDYQKLRK